MGREAGFILYLHSDRHCRGCECPASRAGRADLPRDVCWAIPSGRGSSLCPVRLAIPHS